LNRRIPVANPRPFRIEPGSAVTITIGELPRGSCNYLDKVDGTVGHLEAGKTYDVPERVRAGLQRAGIPITLSQDKGRRADELEPHKEPPAKK
jgi:hypothetical protein